MSFLLCLFLLQTPVTADLMCTIIYGILKQIDAGDGEVYGINDDNDVFHWNQYSWNKLSSKLKHVTVGPAGVWGVNNDDNVYVLDNNNWLKISGGLTQIDAGGDKFISGVTSANEVFCKNQEFTESKTTSFSWVQLNGSLTYYSCGPLGCWGVNANHEIYYRSGVSPTYCKGDHFYKVTGNLIMVEVGTDGSVYGVDDVYNVYRRWGICPKNPTGTSWIRLTNSTSFKHVTYDAGYLWLLTQSGNIFKCAAP